MMKLPLYLLLLILPFEVEAQFNFTTNNGAITITGYTDTNPVVIIPSTTNGYPVIAIGPSAFEHDLVTNVTIPNTITSIGDYAFGNCTILASVNIPDSVTNIGQNAFWECFVPTVTIPNSVVSIGVNAFEDCARLTSVTISNSIMSQAEFAYCFSLTNVTFAGTVTSIPQNAFEECTGLPYTPIPNTVTNIGSGAFAVCTNLTSINIPNSVTAIGTFAFQGCTNLTSITVPNSVVTIGADAFEECVSLTNVLIGSGVTNIGSGAFSICPKLIGVYFLGNAPGAGSGLFNSDNYYVTAYYLAGKTGWSGIFANILAVEVNEHNPTLAITAPNIVQNLTNDIFIVTGTASRSAALSGVWLQVNSNGWSLVSTTNNWTNWTTVANILVGTNLLQAYTVDGFGNSTNISTNLIYISDFTFVTNNGTLTITGYAGPGGSIIIPTEINDLPVVSIGSQAFFNENNITSVSIPNDITNIGDAAFQSCTSLTNITIPNSVTSVGDSAFQSCSGLINMTIPNSVTSVGNYAFSGSGLTNIVIGTNVASIGDDAFSNCTGLASIYFTGNAPTGVGSDVFLNDSNVAVYYLPGTTGWNSTFASVTAVEINEMVSITTPENDQSLTNGIFTVTGIAGGSVPVSNVWFQINTNGWVEASTTNNWTNWTVAASLTTPSVMTGTNVLQAYAVDNLGDISPTVSNNIVFLCDFRFQYQNGVLTITALNSTNTTAIIPATINGFPVTSIGGGAFSGCFNLTNVIIGTNVTTIGGYAFNIDENLISVTIPDSVTHIGGQAFNSCLGLTSVAIPASVTDIDWNPFVQCYGLQEITVDPSNPAYSSLDGVLFNKNQSILVAFPGGKGPNYTVPDSVTNIAYMAFAVIGSLKSVIIPASVTAFEDWSFYSCYGLTGMYFEGDPPALGGSHVFFTDSGITVYYPPNIAGWGATFGSFPATLWLPQMQNNIFNTQANQFGFNINWANGQTVVVEACTNLFNPVWSPLWTNTLAGNSTNFSDPQWINYPSRFYRISSP